MSDQRKEYPNSGMLYKKNPPPTDPNHAPYGGSVLAQCPCCNEKTDYWLDGRVKEGAKGKFIGLKLKPKKPATSRPQPQTTRREENAPDESDGVAF